MTVRDFRANFQRLTEPVQVLRSRGQVEILGTWTPDADRTAVRYPASKTDSDTPERPG